MAGDPWAMVPGKTGLDASREVLQPLSSSGSLFQLFQSRRKVRHLNVLSLYACLYEYLFRRTGLANVFGILANMLEDSQVDAMNNGIRP